MIWSRLKNFKCPNDNHPLITKFPANIIACTVCEFYVSGEKFNEIVKDLYKGRKKINFEIEGDNAYQINNLKV